MTLSERTAAAWAVITVLLGLWLSVKVLSASCNPPPRPAPISVARLAGQP